MWNPLIGTCWFLLVACGGPAPEPKAAAPAAPVPAPEAAVPTHGPSLRALGTPRLPERAPVVQTVKATAWGAEVEACQGPCTPAVLRAQASSTKKLDTHELSAERATDGDATTAWCGVGGVGQRVSFALPEAWDVERIHLGLAGPDGSGAWTRAKLVTDRRDHLTVELEAPAGNAASPPVLDVDLREVQFVQLEVLELADDGPACIVEVSIEGVETADSKEPGDHVEHDPPGDETPAGDQGRP
ncbi:MAG: hypothetical protein R3F61_32065 [Myxococcota bacterium]